MINKIIHTGKRGLAVLIDPDKQQNNDKLLKTIETCVACNVDFIMVGGSLVSGSTDSIIDTIKKNCHLPVVLFPGSLLQLTPNADAIFLLSLISGRNPEFLIGNHVLAAPMLKKSKLEVIPVGYILIESGHLTSVQYISNTIAIPSDKPDIAVATAIAGEMLGLKTIYLEAGSGALNPVPEKIIRAVKSQISIPLIVGGGIKTREQLELTYQSGADIVVIGNSLENDPDRLFNMLG